MKKWYTIQFVIIAVITLLYGIWGAVLTSYGISLHAELISPLLIGILSTSGILMLLMTIIKE